MSPGLFRIKPRRRMPQTDPIAAGADAATADAAGPHRPVRALFAGFLLAFIAFQAGWAYWLIHVQAREAMTDLRTESLRGEAVLCAAMLDSVLENKARLLKGYACYPPLLQALRPPEPAGSGPPGSGPVAPELAEAISLFAGMGQDACLALYRRDGARLFATGAPCDAEQVTADWLTGIFSSPETTGVGLLVHRRDGGEPIPRWRLTRPVVLDGMPAGVLSVQAPVDMEFVRHSFPDKRQRMLLLHNGAPVAAIGGEVPVFQRVEQPLAVSGFSLALEAGDTGIERRTADLLHTFLPLLLAGTAALVAVFHRLGHRLFVAPQEALQSLRQTLEERNRRLERVIQEQQQVDVLLETKSRLLEESETLLSAIISDQTELICRYKPDGVITFANDAFCAFFGVEREQLLGTILHPKTVPGAERDIFADSVNPGLPSTVTLDHWVVAGSGEERRLQWTRRALYDDHGAVSGFQGVGRDVTTEYELEKALRDANEELEARIRARTRDLAEREELLSRIFSGLRAAMVIVRPGDCAVVEANTVARALLACGEATEKCADLYQQVTQGICPQPGETGLAPLLDQEHVLRRADGLNIPVRWSLLPVPWQGAPHLALVFFDATGQKTMERRLNQAQKLESIGQLAAGVAHEINTPIQYVGDNLRFLRGAFEDLLRPLTRCGALADADAGGGREPDTQPDRGADADENGNTAGRAAGTAPQSADAGELLAGLRDALAASDADFLAGEVPRAIEQALEGVERVAAIVLAMRKFSHPEATEKRPGDINQLVRDTVTVSRNEWKYVAEVEMRLAPDLPLIPCLPGDLAQVLLNVVVNAAHAIAEAGQKTGGDPGADTALPPPPGRITITTLSTPGSGASAPGHVEIRIADTGIGIPEELRDRVYDPFFTTKEVGKGTGQGLAIAHDIVVKKHGGAIDFISTPGQGTTFIITLPA